jgi:hypothetical protein
MGRVNGAAVSRAGRKYIRIMAFPCLAGVWILLGVFLPSPVGDAFCWIPNQVVYGEHVGPLRYVVVQALFAGGLFMPTLVYAFWRHRALIMIQILLCLAPLALWALLVWSFYSK